MFSVSPNGTASRSSISSLLGHTAPIKSIRWSPGGNLLATASRDRTIRLWSLPDKGLGEVTMRAAAVLTSHSGSVMHVDWAPSGNALYSVSDEDRTLQTWLVADGVGGVTSSSLREEDVYDMTSVLEMDDASVSGASDVLYSPSGKHLAGCDFVGGVFLWSLPASAGAGTPDVLALDLSRRAPQRLSVADEHGRVKAALAWSPSGQTLAVGRLKRVRLWTAAEDGVFSMAPSAFMGNISDSVRALGWSPSGRSLAHNDGRLLVIWQMNAAGGPEGLEPAQVRLGAQKLCIP